MLGLRSPHRHHNLRRKNGRVPGGRKLPGSKPIMNTLLLPAPTNAVWPWKWICEFCFRTVNTDRLPDNWKWIWQSAVCPECSQRVERNGGFKIVCGGGFLGGGERTPPKKKGTPILFRGRPRGKTRKP